MFYPTWMGECISDSKHLVNNVTHVMTFFEESLLKNIQPNTSGSNLGLKDTKKLFLWKIIIQMKELFNGSGVFHSYFVSHLSFQRFVLHEICPKYNH